MTAQEVFDKVALGLKAQGTPGYLAGACHYLAEDGTKCAAGQLIPDSQYNVDLEGHRWVEIEHLFPDLIPHRTLIMAMQCVHDECADMDADDHAKIKAIMAGFLGIAVCLGLKTSALGKGYNT